MLITAALQHLSVSRNQVSESRLKFSFQYSDEGLFSPASINLALRFLDKRLNRLQIFTCLRVELSRLLKDLTTCLILSSKRIQFSLIKAEKATQMIGLVRLSLYDSSDKCVVLGCIEK
jgi:hypothetical protein